MKPLILALTILLIGTAEAKPQKYWTCVDASGQKSAQDFPCPEPLENNVTPRVAEAPVSSPVQVQQKIASPKTSKKSPHVDVVGGILKPLIPLFCFLLFALVAVTAVKAWVKARVTKAKVKIETKIVRDVVNRIEPTDDLLIQGYSQSDGDSHPRPTHWSLDLIRLLEWKRFEDLCEGLWNAKGYSVRQTGFGADGGVDVVIMDRGDPKSVFAIIQCKAWNNKQVGVETVRALWGAKDHFKAKLAIFYGLSGFSADAKEFASEKHLKLISGEELLAQICTLSSEQQRELLARIAEGDYTTPSCPKCGRKMTRHKGRSQKGDFWGCPNFRRCHSPIISVRT